MNMKIPQRYLQNRTSNIRQDYATINKSIVDKLNPPNLYRFFCLSLYRNDYYKVRWRIKDLAKRTGEKEDALKNFNKDIEAVLIRKRYREAINHPLIEFVMRSIYCIPPIEHPNFITLSHLFMKLDLDIKVKGYYIKLLLIAEDNKILLTPNKLADKLGMGKKSVESYNLDLYGAGLLRYIPKGIELTPKELLLDNDIAKLFVASENFTKRTRGEQKPLTYSTIITELEKVWAIIKREDTTLIDPYGYDVRINH